MSRSRSFLPLLIIVLALSASSCRREEPALPVATEEQPARLAAETVDTEVRNPCGEGSGVADPFAPIVCVDDTGSSFIVNPDPIRAHDRKGKDDPAAVVIHWFTHTGQGDLRLEFHPTDSGEACVESPQCNGPGRCMARVIGRPQGSGEITCKYDVWVEGSAIPRLDPETVIVPCC
jgi:hypothetical protein